MTPFNKYYKSSASIPSVYTRLRLTAADFIEYFASHNETLYQRELRIIWNLYHGNPCPCCWCNNYP